MFQTKKQSQLPEVIICWSWIIFLFGFSQRFFPIELLNSKLHVSPWQICIAFVWPRGSLKLTAPSSQSERHLHFAYIRLCLALLFIISIQNCDSFQTKNTSQFKKIPRLPPTLLHSAALWFLRIDHCDKEIIDYEKSYRIMSCIGLFSIIINLPMFWSFNWDSDLCKLSDLYSNETFHLLALTLPHIIIRFILPTIFLIYVNFFTLKEVRNWFF